jgi:hypothetical protein
MAKLDRLKFIIAAIAPRIKADGKIVGFEPNGAGELICTVLNT